MLLSRGSSCRARHDRSIDDLAADEALDVGSELSEIFRCRPRRVAVHRLVDEALRHGGIHCASLGLPDENRRVIMAVVSPIGVVQLAATRVGRRCGQEHSAGNGCHRRAQRGNDLAVGICRGFVAPPEGDLVTQRGDDREAARTPEACRLDFDGDVVAQLDRIVGIALDQRREGWNLGQQRGNTCE